MLGRFAIPARAVIAFAATVAFAQLPQDTLRARAYAPNTVRQKFLAENPALVEGGRTEQSIHFRRPGGTRSALISQFLYWSDPETGRLVPVEPALWTLDNGWRLEGGPVKARIVAGGGRPGRLSFTTSAATSSGRRSPSPFRRRPTTRVCRFPSPIRS